MKQRRIVFIRKKYLRIVPDRKTAPAHVRSKPFRRLDAGYG